MRLSLIGLLIALALSLFYFTIASKYDLELVGQLPAPTHILDRHGREIQAGEESSRHLAQRQDLPDFLVECLEAREDARFFQHSGVDFRGLARATFRNLKDWDFTQGASTLTMQLARNTYEMRAKTIHRKLLEIALTLRIEQHYTKNQILTHYLNRIYFGSGCHGIQEAAQTYFGKPVSELNQGESALLIGIIRGPHIFSPIRNLNGAREQQSEVLNRLIDIGRIDDAEKQRIQAIPIVLVPTDQRSNERSYAIQAVRTQLETILEVSDIRLDGLTVHTTLDINWLLHLETELSKSLIQAEASDTWPHLTHLEHPPGQAPEYLQCGAITLESKTGEILALIGGRDFLDSRHDRANHARRDLGTVIEPWIAAAAAERGKRILPGNPLLTGRQLGPHETARIIKRCGINGPFLDTEDLFRGGASATPIELATALATLANGGKRPSPQLITRITDAQDQVLYQSQAKLSQAITRAAADSATKLFTESGAIRSFTGATGSGRDAWLLRLGPQGSTVIWLGLDQPARIAPKAQLHQLLDQLSARLNGDDD